MCIFHLQTLNRLKSKRLVVKERSKKIRELSYLSSVIKCFYFIEVWFVQYIYKKIVDAKYKKNASCLPVILLKIHGHGITATAITVLQRLI